MIWWYENGQKQFEAEYLKGIPQGRTAWYARMARWSTRVLAGRQRHPQVGTCHHMGCYRCPERTGNRRQRHTRVFPPNGQKRLEETFTNGLLSASSFWDDMGEPVESVDPSFIPPPPKLD